jgi:hypothetical protein
LFWFDSAVGPVQLKGTVLLFFGATGNMDESGDESLTRQVLSMVLENQALFPYLVGWAAFNVVILILLVYIAIRLTLGQK